MLMNNYLSVCMFQLDIQLDCNSTDEYLIVNDYVLKQIEEAFKCIEKFEPDIAMFPELSYLERYDERYIELSLERIIVAGSYYKDGINTTVVFQNRVRYEIKKSYASGAEPMARKISYIEPEKFISSELVNHEFIIKGKKIYIFNCVEYYHVGYFIARNVELRNNLFGIFTICSNSNTRVFEEETVAIHNHNEKMYTFMLNCFGTYCGGAYGDGSSYIYGPVSTHEKEWLKMEGIDSKRNASHIVSLEKDKSRYIYGKFSFQECLSIFGRSDDYSNNPKNLIIGDL